MNQKSILPAIEWAADLILRGRLVAFPTETVYGLGAHALASRAVAGIFEAKQRPFFDPLIVHVAATETLCEVVERCSRKAEALVERFWPGPLTLVLGKAAIVPGIVTAGLPTVAVRMPDHPMALELIRTAGVPIAAPSANRFGCLSPTTPSHVRDQLGDRVDYILDGGPCVVGVESTILDLTEDPPRLLRPGGLPIEEIESVVGPVTLASEPSDRPHAPGQLPSHYAPRTPLLILDEGSSPPSSFRDVGLLCLRSPRSDVPASHVEILSRTGDLREAAGNLFAALHRLDALNLDVLYAEPVPETGLGRAIMNRLRKASTSFPSAAQRPLT
jgi:L-threonylcarbamoyladenylate synthase